jgi:phospholipid-binding lipoprotein MlaA
MLSACKRLSVRCLGVVLLAAVVGGCALGTDPRDPFEPINRGIYSFNEGVDKAILKPAAQAYRAVLPQFVRSSVSNFFSNINDVVVALNNLLQGKFTTAYSDLGRIAINSTIGLLGLFDVASEAGIEKHDEDFGQTLGRWGVGDGPFVMIPIFGPSTGRDLVGRVVDYKTDPVTYVDPSRNRNQLWGTRAVNRRAELLDASTVLHTAALDPYEFVRDAYLQRRRNLIHDGAPPPDKEFLDPPPPAAPKKSSLPSRSPFPSAAEPTSEGSTLVSGPSRVPVQSAFQEERARAVRAMPAGAPAPQPKPRWWSQEGTGWVSGEAPTPAQLDALEKAEPVAIAAAPQRPQSQQSSTATKVWRSLEQLFR